MAFVNAPPLSLSNIYHQVTYDIMHISMINQNYRIACSTKLDELLVSANANSLLSGRGSRACLLLWLKTHFLPPPPPLIFAHTNLSRAPPNAMLSDDYHAKYLLYEE